MNSTERLLACLTGQMPDRVPISTYELVGWADDAWENQEDSYRPLMDFIRQHTDCLYMTDVDVPNLRARDGLEVERWDQGEEHYECRTIHAAGRKLTRLTSYTDSVKTLWTRKHWCEDPDDLAAMLSRPWEPGPTDSSPLEKAWRDLDGTRGLPLISIGDALCELSEYFAFETFMVLAMTETDAMLKFLQQIHERRVEALGRMLQGPVKNTLWRICGPEYAAPPYLPPALFAKFVTPWNRQYVEMIHKAGAFARIHIHGKVGRVLDQLAAIGADAVDPVEPIPDGDIDVKDVKAALGDKMCLMGGIELKHLEAADEAFVEQLTRKIVAEGKPGGRFVIMPTAAPINIPLAKKTERNYIRFIETAIEAGKY